MLLYFFVTMMIFFCAADMGKNDYMNSDRKKDLQIRYSHHIYTFMECALKRLTSIQ